MHAVPPVSLSREAQGDRWKEPIWPTHLLGKLAWRIHSNIGRPSGPNNATAFTVLNCQNRNLPAKPWLGKRPKIDGRRTRWWGEHDLGKSALFLLSEVLPFWLCGTFVASFRGDQRGRRGRSGQIDREVLCKSG